MKRPTICLKATDASFQSQCSARAHVSAHPRLQRIRAQATHFVGTQTPTTLTQSKGLRLSPGHLNLREQALLHRGGQPGLPTGFFHFSTYKTLHAPLKQLRQFNRKIKVTEHVL